MGNRIILILALAVAFPAANTRADTNSWIHTGTAFWDTKAYWSVTNYPTITNAAVLITNSATKTVIIDLNVAAFTQDSLTITNLTVGGTGGASNTLALNDMNSGAAVPLHILNGLTVTNGGVLQITNSMLRVDGLLGGTFNVDGTIQIFQQADVQVKDATFSTNAVAQFALGTSSSTVVVSNNLTVGGTVNVVDGGGFTTTNYTLFTYGGTLANSGLAVGTMPTNFVGVIDTSTAGQVDLVVSPAPPPTPSTFRITSIARQGDDIVITWLTTGAGTSNIVQVAPGTGDGSYTPSNFADLSPSMLVTSATTNYTDAGGALNTPSRFYRIRSTGAQGIILDPFQAWQLQFFGCTNCAQAQPDADPLGKGMSNTNQFLVGLNPTNPSSVFRLISAVRQNNDVVVTWKTAGAHTNALQATAGDATGSYSNNFTDISGPIIPQGIGDVTTNYPDVGGATNIPSRFYRVRLVP